MTEARLSGAVSEASAADTIEANRSPLDRLARSLTPTAQGLRDAPQALRKIEYRLNAFDSSVEDMPEARDQVEKLSRMGDDSEPIEVAVRDQDSELAGGALGPDL